MLEHYIEIHCVIYTASWPILTHVLIAIPCIQQWLHDLMCLDPVHLRPPPHFRQNLLPF